MDNNQIRKAIEYSISELNKSSELLNRGLSDIALLKEDAHSLREFQQKSEEQIVNFLTEDGDLPREKAVKLSKFIRGYVLNGLWCRSAGWTFKEAIDHASGSLAPDLKKSFDDAFRGLIMNVLYGLEEKGFIEKLQKYFVFLVQQNPSSNIHDKMSEVVKMLDIEYKNLDKEMKDELTALQ